MNRCSGRTDVTARITTDLDECARILRSGGLVAFGTETVYGLGADALNATAVARIFEAKQRPAFDPLIVHLADPVDLKSVAASISQRCQLLIDRFWPGPLTILFPKRNEIPELVTAGLSEVGVRIPATEPARELIRRTGRPIAAPSANLFGQLSPTTAQHVREQLAERIDLILDTGPCPVGVESTVVRVPAAGPVQMLRPGGISLEELRETIGEVVVISSLLDGQRPLAPGQLHQHYAPRTPLRIVTDWHTTALDETCGVLCFRQLPARATRIRAQQREVLSPEGSLTTAAANLFSALHRLDQSGCREILAELCPAEGLGLAINDRLRRAAASEFQPC